MKNFKFDVSWKGILVLLIILGFLLNILDTVVHGAEIPTAHYNTSVCDRMLEFQRIEDRELSIYKAEDESYSNDWIRVYDAKAVNDYETMYYYRYYDGFGHELHDDSITLSNKLVDTCYQITLYMHDDETWQKAISSVCEQYEMR